MSAAMPLIETWVFASPRPDGWWELRCTRCSSTRLFFTSDGARQAVNDHTCPQETRCL